MNIKEPFQIGKSFPVWWNTNDERPGGCHLAIILEIRPYKGIHVDLFTHILKLSAPNTKRGWLEMPVNKKDQRTWN